MDFVLYRYAVVILALVGLGAISRFRSYRLGLGLVVALGLSSWLFAWVPLEQPYGLAPGTEVSFDFAVVSRGAAGGDVLESWIVDRGNPRPLWGLVWHVLAPDNPVRARTMLELLPPLLMILLPLAVFWFVTGPAKRDSWVALTCAFTAVLASSVPLDGFGPHSLFHRGFFFAPYRVLAIALALGGLGLAWRGGAIRLAAGGLLLGILAPLDVSVFYWSMLSLVVAEALMVTTSWGPLSDRPRTWPAMLVGILVAAPQLVFISRGELLSRIPTSEEVLAIRTAFKDVGFASVDMQWIFVLAVVGIAFLWKRREREDVLVVSMTAAAYVAWIAAALMFHRRPFAEPEAVFHILRFQVALTAGLGGFELFRHVSEYLEKTNDGSRWPRWIARAGKEPLAFALVVLCLLPGSAAFLWRPNMTDPLYHPSTYEWDASVERLERWVLSNTEAHEIVLTGDETGEWIAALTGRKVWSAERVLPRAEARERRRALRRIFTAREPEAMRRALASTGASVLILDGALREVFWEFDETRLESSALFDEKHQIGDRYSIYRVIDRGSR